MKTLQSLMLAFLLCLATAACSTQTNSIRTLTEQEQQMVEVDNAFGFKLFSKINEGEDGNVFISPLSVSMVLGMALNGADGDTKQAILDTLEISGLTDEAVNQSYQSLIGLLKNLDSNVILELANSVWHASSWGVKQDYLDSTQTYFDAEVSELDFNNPAAINIVNNWVNQKTHGKISRIVDDFHIQTAVALLNAVYFEGIWEAKFKESVTRDSVFYLADDTEKPCRMMSQTSDFNYSVNKYFAAIDLPYGSGSYSMTILLPHNEEENQYWGDDASNWTVDDIVANLTPQNWDDWTSDLYKKGVLLYLPRFSMEYDIEMKDVLSVLGMEVAFDELNADFSRMTDEHIWIDKVTHKTYIEVDEEGTRAAAVSSAISIGCSAAPELPIMLVDHPFVLVIREQHTNTILFMGKIMNPDFGM